MTTQPSKVLLATLLCAVGLMACSDDPKKKVGPDAGPTPDAPVVLPDTPVGPTCTTTALGAQDILNEDTMFIAWGGPVTTDLGDGGESTYQLEFYGGIEPSLVGPIDLSAGNQSNYKTCAVCIRAFSANAAGEGVRQFFQSGGTVTLTEDPFTNNHMIGSATDVTLTEVTIDDMFNSTPVVGGVCLSLGTVALDADRVPNAWTCALPAYEDGANCDCSCGPHDPDCDIAAAPVVGCTAGQVCSADVCTSTCNVLSNPPVGCTTGTCGFDTATQDICYTDAAAVDPAILGATCAAGPTFCAVANTVATGICDNFVGDDGICREACDAAADCNAGERCAAIIPPAKGVCITPPANDTCQTATQLVIGTPVTGSTHGGIGNYNLGLETATCTGFAQPGPDTAYRVLLTMGQAITVTLSGVAPTFDPSIAIVGPAATGAVCDASPIVCHKGADVGLAGANETFMYTATAAGLHYIIVDSFENHVGAYTLTVTSP